jgi:hypothetical protein
MRAQGSARRGGAGPGSDSSLSPIRSRKGDGPDRRDPPVSEGGREEERAARGEWAGQAAGPRERRKEEERPPGWAVRERKRGSAGLGRKGKGKRKRKR